MNPNFASFFSIMLADADFAEVDAVVAISWSCRSGVALTAAHALLQAELFAAF